jgi:hypothetical protein
MPISCLAPNVYLHFCSRTSFTCSLKCVNKASFKGISFPCVDARLQVIRYKAANRHNALIMLLKE